MMIDRATSYTPGSTCRQKRGGFALLMVMILLGVTVVLGLSFLSVAAMKAQTTENFSQSMRARYLAESGLQHGMYVIQNDPNALKYTAAHPLGPFYLDASHDSYTLYTSTTSIPYQYMVTARATAGSLTQSSAAVIFWAGGPQTKVSQAMLLACLSAWVPDTVHINGNVHVNGQLMNNAYIHGSASTTNTIWDPYSRVTGSTTQWAAPVAMPNIDWNNYNQYKLDKVTYNCIRYKSNTLAVNSAYNNGGIITAANPGGVLWLTPLSGSEVTLSTNINFQGTIIANCDVVLSGNATLTAVNGFPAIITTGRILIENGTNATITGMVVATGGLVPRTSYSSSSRTTINGGLISETSGYDWDLGGTHTLNFQEAQCKLYDFSQSASTDNTVEVITVIK